MDPQIDAILKRLLSKGSNALELLEVYKSRDYEHLWVGSPRLYRAFTRKLISESHPNRAFELARDGLRHHKDDRELTYLLAFALARGGNVSAASEHLATLFKWGDLSPSLLTEALSLEGRLAKDLYERTRSPLRRTELAAQSAASYKRAADASGGDPFPLINAATMTMLAGDAAGAKKLAQAIIERIRSEPPPAEQSGDYWRLATLAEAYVLQSAFDEAGALYRLAVARASEHGDLGSIASMRRNALLLKEKMDVDNALIRQFYVGSVVVFAGHMLDHPGRAARDGLAARFPSDPQLIRWVNEEIKIALNELNANIGFSSAACGSDILFAELMLERGAELHIVIPFALNDFLSTSVDFDLPAFKMWRARFTAVLERAAQVHYATGEGYLGHQVLFEFVSGFTQGLTLIRSQQRGVVPQSLVVLDRGAPKLPGGTANFLESWTNAGYESRAIDLAVLRGRLFGDSAVPAVAPSATPTDASGTELKREIKYMLFADVKDFSKMREEHSPQFFLRFLREVKELLDALPNPPTFSNTWGDGLYLVFNRVTDCAAAALGLLERSKQINWKELGFESSSPLRIGVHAGPVFSGMDPIIGKKSYFGSQVNRAARIEPVTIPGCAYTSEQFAALLAVEPGHDFVSEYIGIEPLAKEYDRCPLYRLARR